MNKIKISFLSHRNHISSAQKPMLSVATNRCYHIGWNGYRMFLLSQKVLLDSVLKL